MTVGWEKEGEKVEEAKEDQDKEGDKDKAKEEDKDKDKDKEEDKDKDKEDEKTKEGGEDKPKTEEQKDAHQIDDKKAITNNEVVLQRSAVISNTIQKDRHATKYLEIKKKKLTKSEKEQLFLEINLKNVSHLNIRRASNLECLSELKMLFLEALSLKLNQFEKYDNNKVNQNY